MPFVSDPSWPVLKPVRSVETPLPAGFVALPGETVRCLVELNGREEIADLLAMTPHLFRASAEGKARVAALESLSVTVDVRVTCYLRE